MFNRNEAKFDILFISKMICIALDLNSGRLITNSEYYPLHHGITYIFIVVYIVVIYKCSIVLGYTFMYLKIFVRHCYKQKVILYINIFFLFPEGHKVE